MAHIGLKYPVFAPIVTEPAFALPTYGQGILVGNALLANVAIVNADGKLYGSDRVVESENGFLSGTITTGIDDLSGDAKLIWLGAKSKTVNGVSVIRSAGNYIAPNGGYGYYRIRKKNGVRSIDAYWYYKTQWNIPSEEAATKGETITWQTPSIVGTIMTVADDDATWRDEASFTTEVAAVAWLNELANIGTPASKTALQASIATAQALDPETYTSASWVDAANALAEAVSVAAMESPSQVRVDNVKSLLDTAVASLDERA